MINRYFLYIALSSAIITTSYAMESQQSIVLQCNDGKEYTLPVNTAKHIPLFNNCLVDARKNDTNNNNDNNKIILPINLQSSDWQLIDNFLPSYKNFCTTNHNIDSADFSECWDNGRHFLKHWPTNISTKYSKKERFDEVAKWLIAKIQAMGPEEKKAHKIYELYERVHEYELMHPMDFNHLTKLFRAADYLEMFPLAELALLRIMKTLEHKDVLENFIKAYRINQESLLHHTGQTSISNLIWGLEKKEVVKTYHIQEDRSNCFINSKCVKISKKGSIVKIGSKERPADSNLQIALYSYKKPKVSLLKNCPNDLNFLELLLLRCLKKQFQVKNLSKTKYDWRHNNDEWQKLNSIGPHVVLRLINPKYKVKICRRHNPSLYKIYSSLKEKNSDVQAMVSPRYYCSKCINNTLKFFGSLLLFNIFQRITQ